MGEAVGESSGVDVTVTSPRARSLSDQPLLLHWRRT